MHFPGLSWRCIFYEEVYKLWQNLTRVKYFGTMSDNVVNNFVIFLMVLQ